MNISKTVEMLTERASENNKVSTSYADMGKGVTLEIGCYPRGVRPARKVLDDLFDWAEDRGLDDVVEKIIELEELW